MPPTVKITLPERTKRLDAVRQALASVRPEGPEPDEAQSVYRRYVDGELTLQETGAEIEALRDREYGPYLYPGKAEATARRIDESIHSRAPGGFDTGGNSEVAAPLLCLW
ncbi:MAG TPA: antitoxin VbhA family protein [Candidatus Acidoferrales bacterium]|jgi:hypothetical protein|nr:antitoxin VbhA family protein [Candidatus Acidoferrales bacterium]